jgi:hypothetical protein
MTGFRPAPELLILILADFLQGHHVCVRPPVCVPAYAKHGRHADRCFQSVAERCLAKGSSILFIFNQKSAIKNQQSKK